MESHSHNTHSMARYVQQFFWISSYNNIYFNLNAVACGQGKRDKGHMPAQKGKK